MVIDCDDAGKVHILFEYFIFGRAGDWHLKKKSLISVSPNITNKLKIYQDHLNFKIIIIIK